MDIYSARKNQNMLLKSMSINGSNEKAHCYYGFDIEHNLLVGTYIKFPSGFVVVANSSFLSNTKFFLDAGLITIITNSIDYKLAILVYAIVD